MKTGTAISRKVFALALCVVLTFAAICLWNAALLIEDSLGINHVWTDIVSALLAAAALGCSCVGRE